MKGYVEPPSSGNVCKCTSVIPYFLSPLPKDKTTFLNTNCQCCCDVTFSALFVIRDKQWARTHLEDVEARHGCIVLVYHTPVGTVLSQHLPAEIHLGLPYTSNPLMGKSLERKHTQNHTPSFECWSLNPTILCRPKMKSLKQNWLFISSFSIVTE